LTQAQAVQEALAGIRPVLGATPPQLKSSRITRWKNEIYTRGSYSFAAVGTKASDFDTLARPQGRLYFAGEHTNGMYRGTAHGAYLSGQRAATELMRALA
jgi:monoamine oxidase